MFRRFLAGAALALSLGGASLAATPSPSRCLNSVGTAVDCGSVPWTYTNITSATTTTVKAAAGELHSLNVNTLVGAATITIYDNTAASGTKIGTITLPSTITGANPFHLDFDVRFSTGLTIVTSGATDLTVASQ